MQKMYCQIYQKIKKMKKFMTKFLKTEILEHVHLNYPKKENFSEMYRQMFLKIEIFLKGTVKFSKKRKFGKCTVKCS